MFRFIKKFLKNKRIKFRKEQLEIVQFLENVNSDVVGIEAPTGAGKTVAYLYYASKWPGKVIISTFTKNLQNQIQHEISKFFPFVQFTVVKGQRNYMCIDKLQLLEPHERELILKTRPPLEIMDKIVASSYYCRPLYNCKFKSNCEYISTINSAIKSKFVIINHFMLRQAQRFSTDNNTMLIIDECHKLDDIKHVVEIPEQVFLELKEPEPAQFGTPAEYNLAVESFLRLKDLQNIAKRIGISSPGRYEVPLSLELSFATKILYTSATFPFSVEVDSMLVVKDRRNWNGVTIRVVDVNYKQTQYNDVLIRTIQQAMRKYKRVVVLCTSHDQVTFLKSKIDQIHTEADGSIYELKDLMLSGKIQVVAGCMKLWQGFDLPGRKCIVMTKLPFPNVEEVPDYNVSVGKMLFDFKQGLGRMLRTSECSGEIVILDNRILKYPDLLEIIEEKKKLGAQVILPEKEKNSSQAGKIVHIMKKVNYI